MTQKSWWVNGVMTSKPHDLAGGFPTTHNAHVKCDVTRRMKVIKNDMHCELKVAARLRWFHLKILLICLQTIWRILSIFRTHNPSIARHACMVNEKAMWTGPDNAVAFLSKRPSLTVLQAFCLFCADFPGKILLNVSVRKFSYVGYCAFKSQWMLIASALNLIG